MKKETINWELLMQYLNDPQNPAAAQDVTKWLAVSPGNAEILRQVKLLWKLSPELQLLEQLDTQAAVTRLHAAMPAPAENTFPLPQRRYKWFRVAAITIPALLGAWWLYTVNNVTYTEKHTLAAIDSVQLSDNSRVYLDKNSSIRYPDKMKKNRTVFMEQGTAFFEVAGGAGQPFIVKLPASSIAVLGTSFNIQLKENSIDVTVKSGKVKFAATRQNGQELILSAGQGMSYTPATNTLKSFNAINSNEDAWITHELVFVDASLSEVCKKMESLYQVRIKLQGKIPVKKLNATFKESKIEEVLEVLQATYPISVIQQNRVIIITGR